MTDFICTASCRHKSIRLLIDAGNLEQPAAGERYIWLQAVRPNDHRGVVDCATRQSCQMIILTLSANQSTDQYIDGMIVKTTFGCCLWCVNILWGFTLPYQSRPFMSNMQNMQKPLCLFSVWSSETPAGAAQWDSVPENTCSQQKPNKTNLFAARGSHCHFISIT